MSLPLCFSPSAPVKVWRVNQLSSNLFWASPLKFCDGCCLKHEHRKCWAHQRLRSLPFSLSHIICLSDVCENECVHANVCVRLSTHRQPERRTVAPGVQIWSKQSLSVCRYTNSQSVHTAQNREGERVGERHQHRAGERGLGRAAKIRKHHAVLNRGYVEVRKPQWALLLTRIPIQEQPKGTELKSGLCQQGQTVAWLKKTRLSHLSLKNYPEVCSWRGVQPVMVVRFTAAWYILFEVNLALIQYCQETYQCPGWLSEEKWSISFTRAFLKLAQKEYQK